jgi:hypothetical protein
MAQLQQVCTHLESITDDHERRLRTIERILGYGLGALGAAKLVYDLVVAA